MVWRAQQGTGKGLDLQIGKLRELATQRENAGLGRGVSV